MSGPNISSILKGNKLVQREMQSLKAQIIKRDDQLRKLTEKVKELDKVENPTNTDWRHVHEPTEEERNPIVKADLTKLINIL